MSFKLTSSFFFFFKKSVIEVVVAGQINVVDKVVDIIDRRFHLTYTVLECDFVFIRLPKIYLYVF